MAELQKAGFTSKDEIKLAILQMHRDQSKISMGYNFYDREEAFRKRLQMSIDLNNVKKKNNIQDSVHFQLMKIESLQKAH